MADSVSTSEKRQKLGCVTEKWAKPALGRCVTTSSVESKQIGGCGYVSRFKHDPNYDFANDSDEELLPDGALPEHRSLFFPIWSRYYRQIEQSNGFDIYDYPGISSLAGIAPYPEFRENAELLTELAHRAIQEYNEKDCNVFKYKFLKIEKVNYQLTGYHEYFMTVKVLNLTLATPIETFQIHAAKRVYNNDKFILCCRPKEEFTGNHY